MKDLIIVCEDTFGLDIKRIVMSINAHSVKRTGTEAYKIKGYISPANTVHEFRKIMSPFLGTVEEWNPAPDEFFAMGIVKPSSKRVCAEALKRKGAMFVVLRAPWVMAHLDMQYPEGCIIAAQSIMDSARIGAFATLFHSMIGFDAVVGDYSSIMSYANITTAHIGDEVFIGPNCAVMSGCTVHDRTTVLPNSVVVKDAKSDMTLSGVPARRVKA